MESNSSPKTIWTAGTILLVIVAFLGVGVLLYANNRYNQELEASDELRMELAMLRVTQTKLEKSVAHLDLLPPLADADWEKTLTDQINAAAAQAGVRISRLMYSLRTSESRAGIDSVHFTLEVEGNNEAQARCLALLEENVVGIRFDEVEGILGGGDSYYLSVLADYRGGSDMMRVIGRVYLTPGGTS